MKTIIFLNASGYEMGRRESSIGGSSIHESWPVGTAMTILIGDGELEIAQWVEGHWRWSTPITVPS